MCLSGRQASSAATTGCDGYAWGGVHVFSQKAFQVDKQLLMTCTTSLIGPDMTAGHSGLPSPVGQGCQAKWGMGHGQACRLAQCSAMPDSCST